ncbi:hypothetical protein PVK06_020940 [Gossypium arboreum]|uniref:Uncharacterized protein n=1 Tax=Gossypium arboreum TaxID=29729 RepID=A0ABR0PPC7_GOSAR|nr:hypothetical protein PVK06_020940 [Gossypium arboreum]
MQPLKLRQPVQQEHPEPVPHFPLVMVELPLDLPSKRGSRWRKQQQPQCRQSKSWPPCYPAFPTDPKTVILYVLHTTEALVSVLLHDSIGCDPAYNADTNAALREHPNISSYGLPDMTRLNSLLPYPMLSDNDSSELPVKLYELSE